ncbi:MAG: flagellar hook-length control protein FliK, partial [Aeromonas sp.]
MMQTRVTLAPSGAANGLDNASTSKMSGSRVLESGHGALDKGDFAALVTKAQSCEQGTGDAVSSSHGLAVGSDKGLALGSEAIKDEVIDEQEPDTDKKEEGAKAGDFLLQLQDALKLDTSLVTTALVPALSMAIAVPEDGNLLPPTEINVAEGGESAFAPAAGSAAK